jgi:hypothetical protein
MALAACIPWAFSSCTVGSTFMPPGCLLRTTPHCTSPEDRDSKSNQNITYWSIVKFDSSHAICLCNVFGAVLSQ